MVSVGQQIILSLISVGHTCQHTDMPDDTANMAKGDTLHHVRFHMVSFLWYAQSANQAKTKFDGWIGFPQCWRKCDIIWQDRHSVSCHKRFMNVGEGAHINQNYLLFYINQLQWSFKNTSYKGVYRRIEVKSLCSSSVRVCAYVHALMWQEWWGKRWLSLLLCYKHHPPSFTQPSLYPDSLYLYHYPVYPHTHGLLW